jgi:hypothetical protein
MLAFALLVFCAIVKATKIVQLNDLHMCGDPMLDDKTVQTVASLLSLEKPDFVVFNGDLVTGESFTNKKTFSDAWLRLVQTSTVPYAVSLGNHDLHGPMSAEEMLALDSGVSKSKTALISGVAAFNYYVDVDDIRVWIFNSGVGEGVPANVVEWASTVPPQPKEIAFVHIPLPRVNGAAFGGTQYETPHVVTNVDTLEQWASSRNVFGVYFGHDHGNDYRVAVPTQHHTIKPLIMGYGRYGGYGGYSLGKLPRGGRVFEFNETGSFTWIRDEYGNVDAQHTFTQGYRVTLNVLDIVIVCITAILSVVYFFFFLAHWNMKGV